MKNQSRRILVILIVVAVAIITWSVAAKKSSDELSGSAANVESAASENQADTIAYQGEDGKSAMELLRRSHQVEGDTFVTAIDGKVSDAGHFWGYYVNSAMAQVGANEYITKNSDTIEWRYEAIQ